MVVQGTKQSEPLSLCLTRQGPPGLAWPGLAVPPPLALAPAPAPSHALPCLCLPLCLLACLQPASSPAQGKCVEGPATSPASQASPAPPPAWACRPSLLIMYILPARLPAHHSLPATHSYTFTNGPKGAWLLLCCAVLMHHVPHCAREDLRRASAIQFDILRSSSPVRLNSYNCSAPPHPTRRSACRCASASPVAST